ncbi:mannose-1-phosphate guanylyltransferase [Synergistales bacterium]|nr:mannose-1-phosphate guanylyltransferase [Synergistales bacterium]
MKRISVLLVALAVVVALSSPAYADYFKKDNLITLDKEKAGGGVGILYGKYAFTRDQPPEANPVREIGWLTLKPGDAIGFHKHEVNEDVYIIISGTGVFTNDDGSEHEVAAGDITIARLGQSHALKNTGGEELRIISVIAGKTK